MTGARRAAAASFLLLVTGGSSVDAGQATAPVTFSRDIAPIIFQSCGVCHRPGGAGPFSLLTYEDARPRARLISEVTRTGYMPPWKPEPGHGEFLGERRLTKEQVALIARWVETGASPGDPAAVPPMPRWTDGWQAGDPDVVLTLPEYTVPATLDAGADVFRNFAVEVPRHIGTKYVRAVEFRPGSRSVHHANIYVDRTDTSRRLDAADPLPGYKGLIPRSAVFPEGHFLGWTPGQTPSSDRGGPTWRIDGGNHLLVQLHLEPTGKSERVRPALALYFGDGPPQDTLTMLRLGRQSIDIPAGASHYVTSDSFLLPVDAEIIAVQPHAHYRAREVRSWAELPDGSQRPLLRIRTWDFRWQDQYRYVTPVALPKGTRLHLTYTYDNSPENPRNPDSPAKRVRWGFRSADEMGDLWIQLRTNSKDERQVLAQDAGRKMAEESIVGLEVQIGVTPDYAALRNDAALLYLETGQPARAAEHFEHVVRLEPGSPSAHLNLGTALEAQGQVADAVARYREALRLAPDYAKAHQNLAQALFNLGRFEESADHFREMVRLEPADAAAQYGLGAALLAHGHFAASLAPLERAVSLQPALPDAHYHLAQAYAATDRPVEAVRALRSALTIRAHWPEALGQLAWLLATESDAAVHDPPEAVVLGLRAAELTARRDASILDSLAAAHAAAGQFELAIDVAESALALASGPLRSQVQARLALYRAGRPVVVRR